MKVLNKIVLTISLLVTPFLSDAQLRINEVMQSILTASISRMTSLTHGWN